MIGWPITSAPSSAMLQRALARSSLGTRLAAAAISLFVHGVIDYAWSVLLVASPFLFGFAGDAPAFWTALIFGAGGLAYSLATAYELGAFKLIPMRVHLALDAVAGIALALTPFVLTLSRDATWPFVIFGSFAVVASLVTRTDPWRTA